MSDTQKVFMPSQPLEPGPRYGILSGFEPGTRTLEAGYQIAPPFKPLPVDIVLDKELPCVTVSRSTSTSSVPPGRSGCRSSWRGARTERARERPPA
jgi:hypothetical protein